MRNLRNTIWEKRVPSLMGLLLFAFSLGTITWLTSNVILFGAKATVGSTPKNVQISNITDSSFTVSYVTDEKVLGTIAYGKDPQLGAIAIDDQDSITGKPQPHWVHSITIKNLEPSIKYYFSITSGSTTVLDNDAPFEVVTGPRLFTDKPKTETILRGLIAMEDGKVPSEAIAYISTDTSQVFSTLVRADGSYALPIETIRTQDLSGFLPITAQTTFRVLIENATMQSQISVPANQINPIPLVIFSHDYDFAFSTQPLSPSPIASASAVPFPTIEEETINVLSTGPVILTPESNETFKDQQPLFKGKGLPDTDVEITIQSENEIQITVKTDANGNWEFRPNTPLAPGEHMLTIKALDPSGVVKTLTQGFTVYAAGSEFIEPSVSPSPSPTSTPIPTPTKAELLPTPTPNVTNTPTPTPTVITPTPTVVNLSPAPTQPPLPAAGSSSGTMGLIATIIFITIGGMLIFATRGGIKI